MAQLYFYYSSMNAGKSTSLLQSSYNYQERGMNTEIFTAAIDDRFGAGRVSSRLGISSPATLFNDQTDFFAIVKKWLEEKSVHCILIDEAQFLTKQQVQQLTNIVDSLHVPVLAYGIRTDFLGEPFIGSQYLLAWADKLVELKTICHCGKKANFVIRTDEKGKAIKEGAQVEVGGNERYEPLCRTHFKENMWQ